MAAERAPNHADGSVCTDRAFCVRQIGEDKPEENKLPEPNISGYWA